VGQTNRAPKGFRPPPAGSKLAQGGEHDVFVDPDTGRVYKRTYPPGAFGLIGVGRGLEEGATPYFYLRRVDLMNRIFGLNIRVEAVTPGDKPSIVTSEPFHQAADPLHPHPSDEEIEQFMRKHGFEPVSNFGDRGWVRKADGVMALDAFPKNFIKTSKGIVPVDLILQDGRETLPDR